MNLQQEIIDITAAYLEEEIDYFKLLDASKRYRAILEEISNEDMNTEIGRTDVNAENGKALGTFWAALCIDDLIRTRQFIRGIQKAIKDKINIQKPIHILYAGTGPFATLILPFILRYTKQDIKYTFLELNKFTYKILQNTISKIGLDAYDITFVNEDATKYLIDTNNQPDIIISETMQNALAKEQQVPIFINLMNQVKSDTIFIPEKIELFIGANDKGIPIEKMVIKNYHKEAKVFDVSKEAIFPLNKDISFPKKKTTIKNDKLKNFKDLFIFTEIQIYKDIIINITESGLTSPKLIMEVPDDIIGDIIIDTQYIISSDPKLDYKIILPSIQ